MKLIVLKMDMYFLIATLSNFIAKKCLHSYKSVRFLPGLLNEIKPVCALFVTKLILRSAQFQSNYIIECNMHNLRESSLKLYKCLLGLF